MLHKKEYTYDNQFTQVQFPIILGDMNQINDGLTGYFKTQDNKTDYDWTTFYSEAAQETDEDIRAKNLRLPI